MNARLLILTLLPAALLSISQASGQKLSRPAWRPDEVELMRGDDDDVRLLAIAAQDEDPRVREEAVRNLGKTGNPAALEAVRKAVGDGDIGVRCAAIEALARLDRAEGAGAVSTALRSGEMRIILWAMQVARAMRLPGTAQPLVELLAHEDAAVRAVALETLSYLQTAAPAGHLKILMGDQSPAVRLRAAENSLLLSQEGASGLLEELRGLARAGPAPVRSAAIMALGKFDFAGAQEGLLTAALEDASPLLRHAAVVAFEYGAESAQADPTQLAKVLNDRLANDNSPMVRLAAVQTAGRLKCVECTQRVFEIMLAAKYEDWDDPSPGKGQRRPSNADVHYACRLSLQAIGGSGKAGKDAVAAIAADKLNGAVRRLRAIGGLGREQLPVVERNIRACCRLLGEIRSDAALDAMLGLLSADWLRIESNVRIELAQAIGEIGAATGDRRAVPALRRVLERCRAVGREYLVAASTGRMPPPFSEAATAAVIEAIGTLKAFDCAEQVSSAALMKVGRTVFLKPDIAAAGVRALSQLDRADTRGLIEKALCRLIEDPDQSAEARFYAAVAAGELRLKTPDAEEALREALKGTSIMSKGDVLLVRAAAWALQEITGKTPALPPIPIDQGSWIIRKRQR